MTSCCESNLKEMEIKALLKSHKISLTEATIQILKQIDKSLEPKSCQEINQLLPFLNESTVFRNIKKLKDKNIIQEVDLNEGFKRYELTPINHHHHHIICKVCNKIDHLKNCNLSIFEKEFKHLGYTNIAHTIEFYGICSTCH